MTATPAASAAGRSIASSPMPARPMTRTRRPERRDVIGAEGVRGDDDPVGAGGLARDVLGCVESRVAHDRAARRLIVLQRGAAEDLCSRHEFEHQTATLTSMANPRARGREAVRQVKRALRVPRCGECIETRVVRSPGRRAHPRESALTPAHALAFRCRFKRYARRQSPSRGRRAALGLRAARGGDRRRGAQGGRCLGGPPAPRPPGRYLGLALPGDRTRPGGVCPARRLRAARASRLVDHRTRHRQLRVRRSRLGRGAGGHAGDPYPSLADAMYLAFYPAAYVGLVLLLRARGGHFPASVWLDGAIGAVGLGAALGALLFPIVIDRTGGDTATIVTNMAYPIVDLALLGLVACVIGAMQWRVDWSWSLLAGGFALFAVADTFYLYQTARGTYATDRWLDLGWPAAMTLVALASTRPGHRLKAAPFVALARARRARGVRRDRARAPRLRPFRAHRHVAVLLAGATVALVIVRLALTFAEYLRAIARADQEAVSDPLTGLGNRRALAAALDRAVTSESARHALVLFDLDGFKTYNDTFGHPAATRSWSGLHARSRLRGTADRRTAWEETSSACSRRSPREPPVPARRRSPRSVPMRCMRRASSSRSAAVRRRNRARRGQDGDGCDPPRRPAHVRPQGHGQAYRHGRGGRRAPAGDAGAGGRSRRARMDVEDIAQDLAVSLGLPAREREHIRQAAALHDVGKLAIPDSILQKPGPLDEAELQFMRRHTEIGARILGDEPIPSRRSPRSSARATSTGTARAIPTEPPAATFRWARGSSPSAMRTTRWSPRARTTPRALPRRRSPSSAAAPGRSSIRSSWSRSSASSSNGSCTAGARSASLPDPLSAAAVPQALRRILLGTTTCKERHVLPRRELLSVGHHARRDPHAVRAHHDARRHHGGVLRRRRLPRPRHVARRGIFWFIAAFVCLFGISSRSAARSSSRSACSSASAC